MAAYITSIAWSKKLLKRRCRARTEFSRTTGKEYRRLVAAFERIFGATMFFGTESLQATARVVHRARLSFLSETTIWYQRFDAGPAENVVKLSDEFFAEIMAHPIPTDLEAVKALAAAPGALDLFVWLTYRCFTAKGPESIPILALLA